MAYVLSRQGEKVDFWCGVRWQAPATLFLDFRAGDIGTPVEEMTALPSLHAFTPETADTTHYVWAVARDYALGNEEFSAGLRASLEAAFEHEDMPIIRDVHRLMAGRDFWDLKPDRPDRRQRRSPGTAGARPAHRRGGRRNSHRRRMRPRRRRKNCMRNTPSQTRSQQLFLWKGRPKARRSERKT